MQYLVKMTTRVPAGTSDASVDDMRLREARRAAKLARAGHLLRLWRPPLQPGEWRSLGLFSAPNDRILEQVLVSMPLRAWRVDEPLRLSAHPNDGAASAAPPGDPAGLEFLIDMTVSVPPGTPQPRVDARFAREAECASELAAQGHLRRLWALQAAPGVHRALGLWRAGSNAEMADIVERLPLRAWMKAETVPLTPHPNDPIDHPGCR